MGEPRSGGGLMTAATDFTVGCLIVVVGALLLAAWAISIAKRGQR